MINPATRFKVQGVRNASLTPYNLPLTTSRGYTLIELIVAIGLFSLIMTLVSGAYIMMIGLTERAQGAATGIDNLSFALETMTRTIRTGTGYNNNSSDVSTFHLTNADGYPVAYSRSGSGVIMQEDQKGLVELTDPSVHIDSLKFYVIGYLSGDATQPNVTIVISGSVSGKVTQSFIVETMATMRGTDL